MNKMQRITTTHQSISFSRRMLFVGGAQGAIGAVLIGRLGWLAIAQNEKYQLMSESNRVQLIPVPPRRGWIIDRGGKPIAINRSSFRVDLIPQQMDKNERNRIIATVAQVLQLAPDDIDRIKGELEQTHGFRPVPVADNIPYEQYAALTVRLPELPGVAPSRGFARFYPAGSAVGQLIGYVGAASQQDYEKENKNPLLIIPGVKIGKEGLEQSLEPLLRGQPGGQRVEVTARGKLVRELEPKPDRSGRTVQLTIDADLHEYAARRIGDQSCSVVVIDVTNGDILAMPSMPSFNPNNFSDGISQAEWKMLSGDDHLPLVDKALQSLYPSGSTIKPSMAMALLNAGIDRKQRVYCNGSYPLGNHVFHCDAKHGAVDMDAAVVHSCDIYFYEMCRRVGAEKLAPMVRSMGFGEKFDLPFNNQRYGTIPDPQWMMRKYHREWQTYDTINMSIGQGYVLINPLQLAVMASRLATGKRVVPRLLKAAPVVPQAQLAVDADHLAFIRTAMAGVVDHGTAAAAKLPLAGIQMAGKTGTAQTHNLAAHERGNYTAANWKLRDHSLFMAFAPYDNPRYAAAAIVEHGGFGAAVAAPLIRDTVTFLYDRNKAIDALHRFETSIGGSLEERTERKTAAWRAANGYPPLPPSRSPAAAASILDAPPAGVAPSPTAAGAPPRPATPTT
ncbi:penicillin-binding protein 2 [Sphingomonas ginkgonis]|uniref:Penicillin-binding protein 2 n=1 Tax=Sphingomonas ginkgonis TaxID=2315330 RepID=A0A429VB38_9SPHN|nr:penicillin-binding protein 2 [Sphingomonas ginkgonis]RST31190.1 penicillin-binding protein 2 [Sphingomonas ginkgonis]